MSALAASAVTELASWYPLRNQDLVTKKLTLVLTGQGTVANPILASVLGLRKITYAHPAIKSDDSLVIVASPNTDGSILLLKAAATAAPADVTATVNIVVTGEG